MKIAHVVTYVSQDGAFGGPVAVALAQTDELARRGHEVDLLAGWDGHASLPKSDVTHRLFPARRIGPGFSGLIAPGLISWMRRRGREYDVVQVHLGRDLITMTAARIALGQRVRLVVQPHGMVMPDQRLRARAMDALVTRSVLRRSDAVLVLTEQDDRGLTQVACGHLPHLARIPNGIARQADSPSPERVGPPVVMFLARLHARKRVLAFAEAARLLAERGSGARFEVFGPDEGDLNELQSFIKRHGLGDRLAYRGTVPQGQAVAELRRATVYVLPAVREVFPMTVLESLAAGTPVVLGRDCGMAPELERRGAAVLCDQAPTAIADAVEKLLDNLTWRQQLAVRGHECINDWLSIEAIGRQLEASYSQLRLPR